jgi:hypothetical protein
MTFWSKPSSILVLGGVNVEDWGKSNAGKLANWVFIRNPVVFRPVVVFHFSVRNPYQRAEFCSSELNRTAAILQDYSYKRSRKQQASKFRRPIRSLKD